MRDRLIELLKQAERTFSETGRPVLDIEEYVADHLLANGVVIIDPKKYPPVTNRGIIKTICGVPLDEMAELVNAKQDGRIIVPPCKVGGEVYFADHENKSAWYGNLVSYSLDAAHLWFNCHYKCGLNMWHPIEDFGKTVFLTREEAEEKLKERTDACNN